MNRARYEKKTIEQAISKKIKKIIIYKTTMKNGMIKVQSKYTNIKEFKKHYGLNKTNRIVGFTPNYVGYSPAEYVQHVNFHSKCILQNWDKLNSDDFSKSFRIELNKSCSDTRIVYLRNYATSHSHLKEFFKDDVSPYKAEDLLTFLRFTKNNLLRSPKVDFYDKKELIVNIRINEKASSGFYTSRLIGKNKSITNGVSRVVASRLYDDLKRIPIKNFYLWELFGREKDIKLDHSGEETLTGTRAIMSCEDSITTLLMWFAQKIQLGISNIPNMNFNVGGEYDVAKAQRLYKNKYKYDYYVDADWKFYDSNQEKEFLLAAVTLLTNGLPHDRFHDRIRYLIASSVITKYIVIPPGIVVELNRGMPSGHAFGTLVNCYNNIIYWSLIGYNIYGDRYLENMYFEVYGDDTLVFFKDHDKLFQIDEIIKKIGLKSEPIVENLTSCKHNYDEHEQPDFLKRRLINNKLIWNKKKMFDKLIYQSKKRKLPEQIELLTSYITSCPEDTELIKYAKIFYEYLKNNDLIRIVNELDSFKYFEEIVKSEEVGEEIIKRFNIAFINENKAQFFNKFKNIYSYGGIFRNYEMSEGNMKNINDVRVDLMYMIAYPIDFTVKNRFIYENINGADNFPRNNESFIDEYIAYTCEVNFKYIKNIYYKRYMEFS